jgi:hypothetical protein
MSREKLRAALLRVTLYLGLAVVLTWPTALRLGRIVPGAGRTDLWNSLWSLWFVERSLASGQAPWRTELLGFPDGGVLVPADPLGGLLCAPLVAAFGVAFAYGVFVLLQLLFSGLAADALARYLARHESAGWVAGLSFMAAPVLLSGVHNGTSESFGGGWLALSVLLTLRAADRGGWRAVGAGGLGLGLATVSGWYLGLVAWVFWTAALLLGRPGLSWRQTAARLALAAALGMALSAPAAWLVREGASHPDNLVGIKHEKELDSVRRSVGSTDPRGWFVPGDWRSPDFRKLSRYGEEFVHCNYVGYGLILGAAGALWRRRRRQGRGGEGVPGRGGVTAGVLAMGPVVVMDGAPLVLDGRLGIPLPWFLLERLPGFSSLSLLYRLGAGLSLALSVLAGLLVSESRLARFGPPLLSLLVLAELRLASPMRGLPDVEDASVSEPIAWLAEAPDGAVMNFPVVGGRAYLYEQVTHGKPVAGSLNFPNNHAARKVWGTMLQALERGEDAEGFKKAVVKRAHDVGIRYVVVHIDPMARPDMHDEAVRELSDVFPAASEADGVRVHQLW